VTQPGHSEIASSTSYNSVYICLQQASCLYVMIYQYICFSRANKVLSNCSCLSPGFANHSVSFPEVTQVLCRTHPRKQCVSSKMGGNPSVLLDTHYVFATAGCKICCFSCFDCQRDAQALRTRRRRGGSRTRPRTIPAISPPMWSVRLIPVS